MVGRNFIAMVCSEYFIIFIVRDPNFNYTVILDGFYLASDIKGNVRYTLFDQSFSY
jgi:hypothetical protein